MPTTWSGVTPPDHEIVQAFRDSMRWGGTHGLFTAQKWRALVRAARADAGIRARVEATYGDLDASGLRSRPAWL